MELPAFTLNPYTRRSGGTVSPYPLLGAGPTVRGYLPKVLTVISRRASPAFAVRCRRRLINGKVTRPNMQGCRDPT